MRDDSSTLARETELIRAFLAVHQVRMGQRLQVHIDVPPQLGSRAVPTRSTNAWFRGGPVSRKVNHQGGCGSNSQSSTNWRDCLQ